MKLRISRSDHVRLQRAAEEIGVTTDSMVRRCRAVWSRSGMVVADSPDMVPATADSTVITLTDPIFEIYAPAVLRAAIRHCMDRLDRDRGRRRPFDLEPAPQGTTVTLDDGRTVPLWST